MVEDISLNDLENALKKSELKLQTQNSESEARELRLQEGLENFHTNLSSKMDDLQSGAKGITVKLDQMLNMLTNIQHLLHIREETHFQPQIAAGVGTKNQPLSSSYNLQTQKLENPHLQPSSFTSLPPLSGSYQPPSPIVPSIAKIVTKETDDVEETTVGMTEHKVFDDMPYLEIKVVGEGEMIETDVAIGVGVFNEVDVVFNQDDGVFINSRSIQASTKHVAVTNFSKVMVAIIDVWKLFDKRPLRKIKYASEQWMKMCLGDDSIKIEVNFMAMPIPKPPPVFISPSNQGAKMDLKGHISDLIYKNKELSKAESEAGDGDPVVAYYFESEVGHLELLIYLGCCLKDLNGTQEVVKFPGKTCLSKLLNWKVKEVEIKILMRNYFLKFGPNSCIQ